MPLEEGFDLPRSGNTKPGDGCSPSTTQRDADGQVRQGLDACRTKNRGQVSRHPSIDVVADEASRRRRCAQELDGAHRRASGLCASGLCHLQRNGQIFAPAFDRNGNELSLDPADHRPRRLSGGPPAPEESSDGVMG